MLDLSTYFERALGQIRLDSLRAGWLIFGEGFRQGVARTIVKRIFDTVAASILILLALPVMLVTAIVIVLEDGFPIFYRQERVGLNGRLFNVVKFRSMRKDAESDGKPRWATANDDRTTRVGRIIRKLRIDELPQLFSVLTGDMSLVGPRPERPYFVDKLTRDIPFYAVRHSVKPGVTGWAQVSYHYGASVDEDVYKRQSLLWAVLLFPLILNDGKPCLNRQESTGFFRACLLGSCVVVMAAFWERAFYPGLLDISTPYRTTALFWEMHLGGAALDAYLVLIAPLLVWAWRTTDSIRGRLVPVSYTHLDVYKRQSQGRLQGRGLKAAVAHLT